MCVTLATLPVLHNIITLNPLSYLRCGSSVSAVRSRSFSPKYVVISHVHIYIHRYIFPVAPSTTISCEFLAVASVNDLC